MIINILAVAFSLWNSFSRSSYSHPKAFFAVDLGLTWCLGLSVRIAGRAPEVHPWVCDVGRPSEIHSVDIVVDHQSICLRARIDPVHIAIAGRKKSA